MARNDVEVAGDAALFVQPAGHLAAGEAVPEGNGVEAHEGLVPLLQHRALALEAADGVWSIQDDEPDASLGACLHGKGHRPNEGVDPHPHILQVEEERVEGVQHFRGGLAHLSIE